MRRQVPFCAAAPERSVPRVAVAEPGLDDDGTGPLVREFGDKGLLEIRGRESIKRLPTPFRPAPFRPAGSSFYRGASNQDQKSNRQNGQAHDGEQSGGHELAGLHGKAMAKEDGEQDRDQGSQPHAPIWIREGEQEGENRGYRAAQPGDQRRPAAGLGVADDSPNGQEYGVNS